MLNATSQLLLRNLDRLPAGHMLLINPPGDGLVRALAARPDLQVTAFTQDMADARALQAQRVAVTWGAVIPGDERASAVVVFHPKERALADFLLFMARSRLDAGGLVLLVGENKGGIRATEKRLRAAGIALEKLDSARHCQLLTLAPRSAGAPFNLEEWLEVLAIDTGRESLAVASLPGVFSAGRLDEGSAELLETLAAPLSGRVLDMGCGAGVIGAALKLRNPGIELEMVDSHAMAVTASDWTMRENKLKARVYASDGFSEVKGTFDWIISNPPFHDGIATDYRFTEKFIADAKWFLKPGGRLRIVANAHLKYVPVIEAAFGNCRTVSESTRFRVLEAVRK